ncbi:MAG: hypothetical protein AAB213_01625 [Candidatus Omnitrophota bacterium]
MCRAINVSRSGYYVFKTRPKSQNRINNERLLVEINRVYFENDIPPFHGHTNSGSYEVIIDNGVGERTSKPVSFEVTQEQLKNNLGW